MISRILVIVLSVFSLSFLSHNSRLCSGIAPDDQVKGLFIPSFADTGISKELFEAILNRVAEIYTPIISAHGANLVIDRLWESETVNAYAYRSGDDWHIEMHGGWARHPAMTPGAFLLTACHEIGHHLGGSPKKSGRWATNEGQSDYFATLKCARRVLRDWDLPWDQPDPDAQVVQNCESQHQVDVEKEICIASAAMGLEIASALDALGHGSGVKFDTPSTREVTQTSDSHPQAQCRLDTFYHGAVCSETHENPLLDESPIPGSCWAAAGMETGTRRRCWFQPTTWSAL